MMDGADYAMSAVGGLGTFLLGVRAGIWAGDITVGELCNRLRRKKPASIPEEPPGELYGHPLPPVDTLYKSLPSPPQGCAWEIEVVSVELTKWDTDDDRKRVKFPSLELQCRLVDLVAPGESRVVDTYKSDLMWRTWYEYSEGQPWASCYRNRHYKRSGGRWEDQEYMKSEFIAPYVHWAQRLADLRIAQNTSGGGEFKMKT
jgi:hypothetical protein